MDASNAEFEDKADFHAILTPHRSLGRQGFVLLMATLATTWLVTGLFFLSKGAWPIFGFFGLDVLAIQGNANRRTPRDAVQPGLDQV